MRKCYCIVFKHSKAWIELLQQTFTWDTFFMKGTDLFVYSNFTPMYFLLIS